MVPIPFSNLILVVFNATECPDPDMSTNTYEKVSVVPKEHIYDQNESVACFRQTERLPRRRPSSCINRHINVRNLILVF